MPRSLKRSAAVPDSEQERLLAHVVDRTVADASDPTEQAVTGLVPAELLRMAKAWRRDREGVMAGLG